jgi:alpha-glucosidase (family GH31 glycosyl hydrolase)
LNVLAHNDHIPVYVKSGAVLFKKMRRRRSTGAMASDPYSIFIYGASAKGRLYIDDGESHRYQAG